MAGILDEFEKTLSKTSTEVQEHHNSTISAQSSFQRVLKLHLSVIGWGSNWINRWGWEFAFRQQFWHFLDTNYVTEAAPFLTYRREERNNYTNSWNQDYGLGQKP